MYLQKYSYLSSNSPKNTKFGMKLIRSHRPFSGLSGIQIISFEYSLIFMKNSEYDQEIPQSQTADNPVAPRGRAAQPSQDIRKTN